MYRRVTNDTYLVALKCFYGFHFDKKCIFSPYTTILSLMMQNSSQENGAFNIQIIRYSKKVHQGIQE